MTEAMQELSKVLPADRVLTDADSIKTYAHDWTSYYDIKSMAILFPKSPEEVRDIVLWARKYKIGIVPSGGRTGLSGGACATNGEVVVSFAKMNRILVFNESEQSVEVEAGVITEDLQNFAKQKGLFYPVDFASRGSSHIGGNIATNAGGIKVLRYGLTRNWVTSLTFVSGTGEIMKLNSGLVKNATGIDMRHLVIGSEGVLGLVVGATIQLTSAPPPLKVMVLGVSSLSAVMKIFAEFRKHTQMTAFEMFTDKALELVANHTHLKPPLESKTEFYLLVEFECRSEEDENGALKVFERALENSWASDGALAQSDTQARDFWRFREDISEASVPFSPYKNDISVRVEKVPEFLADLGTLLHKAYPTWKVIWFGHIGDGNLHINILRPEGMAKDAFLQECRKVDKIIYDSIRKFSGAISAEHGVGLSKKSFLNYTRSETEIAIMKSIKKVFDPDGIMNPGKVFDS